MLPKLFDGVALTESLEHVEIWTDGPEPVFCSLPAGPVGAVVEDLAPGVYLVEFANRHGETLAMVDLRADQLLVLHHELQVPSLA